MNSHTQYVLYEDENSSWGYNKVAILDYGEDKFELIYVVSEGSSNTVIKRYNYPAYFL